MTAQPMQFRYLPITLLLLFSPVAAFAQNAAAVAPDMAGALRTSGKIYVVVLVLATIFAGIITFLIYLERRISRLERDVHRPA